MAMLRPFFRPLGHLLFDHTRIDAVATRFDALLAEFPEQRFTPLMKRLRRARVAFRQPALQDVEAAGEREPIRVEPFPLSRRGSWCVFCSS